MPTEPTIHISAPGQFIRCQWSKIPYYTNGPTDGLTMVILLADGTRVDPLNEMYSGSYYFYLNTTSPFM